MELGSAWLTDTLVFSAPFLPDVCLPALYMPTPLRHTYTPRAHQYFHPSGKHVTSHVTSHVTGCATVFTVLPLSGTSSHRVTQPPSIFQLPALTLPQTVSSTALACTRQQGPHIMTLCLYSLQLVVAGGHADSGSLLQPDPTRPPCRTGPPCVCNVFICLLCLLLKCCYWQLIW